MGFAPLNVYLYHDDDDDDDDDEDHYHCHHSNHHHLQQPPKYLNKHTHKKNLTVFPCGQKGYICDSLRTDSLSLWGGDLRVQNFELRTDELARVPWSKKWVKVPGTLCFW